MTGNIRNGLGLLVAALIAALAGFALRAVDVPQMQDVGALVMLGAAVLAVVGLWRIAADLLGPQSD